MKQALFTASELEALLLSDESAKFKPNIENKDKNEWRIRYDVMPSINKVVMEYIQSVALKNIDENPKFYDYLTTLDQNIGLDPSMQLKKH